MALPAIFLVLAAASAHAQDRRGPPPMYAPCHGAEEGAACEFRGRHGMESGSCLYIGNRLACIPEHAPRPHGRNAGPPPEHDEEGPPPEEGPALAEPAAPPSPVLAQTAPAAAALPTILPAAAPAAAAPEPPPEKPGFPWTGLIVGIGGAAILFVVWRGTRGASETAPPAAPSEPVQYKPPPEPAPVAPTIQQKPAPASAIGAMIGGDYVIRREIGIGGMGVVYEAVDLKLDRRVALKKMRTEISANARGRERFLSEAKLVAKLQHPNIVTIHGIVEEGSDLYLIFEYVDGETLDDLLARNVRLTAEQAISVLKGVADAVDYAHDQKVIHRDLKPANIMIDKSGHAKVMDFGIAHQAKITISQLTVAEAFGTLAYMPPEQELGKAVRESDVYAFAAVAYESLSGVLPFPGPNFHLQKSTLSFTRPSGSVPPLPARLDPIFERAFQVEPKKRYATTGEFVRTLQGAFSAA